MVIGRLQQPLGKIVDASARFDAARWAAVRDVRAPSKETKSDTYGYWFNYFWEEAVTSRTGLSQADKTKLYESFEEVFERDGAGWKMRAGFPAKEDYAKLRILRNLLHIGFVKVQATGEVKGLNPATEGQALFNEAVIFPAVGGRTPELKIGYRCDSRDYATLISHGGFQARSRSDGVRKAFALDKAWHPYNIGVYADSVFLRRGRSADNCLHTAVSVGAKLAKIVHFPILTDATLYPLLPQAPIAEWGQPGKPAAPPASYKIRTGADGIGLFIAHDTQIYAIRLDPEIKGFHTESWQAKLKSETFPERSVNGVPVENILAAMTLTRKYFWDTSKPQEPKWEMFDVELGELDVKRKFSLVTFYGPTAVSVVERHVRAEVADARNREELVYNRGVRARPAPVAGGAKPSQGLACPVCGAPQRNAMMLKSHLALVHKQV